MPNFGALFQPIQIGPVTAPNRFYQVPHCNGFGWRMPRGHAAMSAMKAEGGWGVVCTEEVEIHHSTDLTPFIEGRLWEDADIPALFLLADSIHKHGSLAGIELAYNSFEASNLYSRTPAFGPFSIGISGGSGYEPGQTRAASKDDLRQVRNWHTKAALRAKQAGFDIIYVYAGHGLSLAMHLLSPWNDRADEYGGPLKNRVRFLRELIEETKDAVGDKCAVAVRLAVDEPENEQGIQANGEAQECIGMLAELPDLWDVNVSDWSRDSATSRFERQGFQEESIAFVKGLTSKPVVGVGRYTDPEAMLAALNRGILDLIGAARPSISDPFLPTKIRENRIEDIRECIGCNICVSSDTRFVPLRCTQNPTSGEEWRRGWHPEKIAPKKSDSEVLIVGAGPAGLEAARALGQRGYRVSLVESGSEAGGRLLLESRLPGMREWRRVIDWRLTQIRKFPNVAFFPGSTMTAADVLESGYRQVIIATGAVYRRDGLGRALRNPVKGYELEHVRTPDDFVDKLEGDIDVPSSLWNEQAAIRQVLIYDDDHYVVGGLLAELLAQFGCRVKIATPAPSVSFWTQFTLEQKRILRRLRSLGVQLIPGCILDSIEPGFSRLRDAITGDLLEEPADGVVLVTDRQPTDMLYRELLPSLQDGRLRSLRLIGDAEAPNLIAQAVFAGHQAAREFDDPVMDSTPFLVERIAL